MNAGSVPPDPSVLLCADESHGGERASSGSRQRLAFSLSHVPFAVLCFLSVFSTDVKAIRFSGKDVTAVEKEGEGERGRA
jgi:hypothetical protein